MLKSAKRLYRSVMANDREALTIENFLRVSCPGERKKYCALDVGCGYGRYLRLLKSSGFEATGVDANQELIRANRELGLQVLHVDEWLKTDDTYDVILMSHVIEHFTPKDLIPFLDGYLDRLKVGGSLIIATPLLTRYFYDDFDHVKPYHPRGIMMVFGTENAQVQYYSRNKLTLEDVWIRRSPLDLPHTSGRYQTSLRARPRQAAMFLSAIMFRLSGGFIGEASGWVGRFKKVC